MPTDIPDQLTAADLAADLHQLLEGIQDRADSLQFLLAAGVTAIPAGERRDLLLAATSVRHALGRLNAVVARLQKAA